MKKSRFFLCIIFTILIMANTKAQVEDFVCTPITASGEAEQMATFGGRFKPSSNLPGQFFRALFVFAQFQSDTIEISGWPKDSLPDWAYNIIDSIPSNSYKPYSLSDYFKRMSESAFDFIGDIHPNIITVSQDNSYKLANVEVLDTLKKQISNFRRYDNWYFSNNNFFFAENNGDKYLDMIFIVYRSAGSWFGVAGGTASLGFTSDIITNDSIKISGKAVHIEGSGVTSKIGKSSNAFTLTAHFAHEYGHYLFGGDHTSMGGLMMGYPWDYHGTYAMNAWERERLGYINIKPAYIGQNDTLRDFVTYGDAIRIYTSSSNPSEYLIIENHQRLNYFDQVIRGGGLEGALDPNATLGKGIYAWYFKGGGYYAPYVWSVQADGGYEWLFSEYRTLVGWGGTGQPDPIKPVLDRGRTWRTLPNNIFNEIGRGDRNRLFYQPVNLPAREDYRWWDRDPLTNELVISREPLGDETDAFKIGYNDQITPWSNPSTSKLLNGNFTPTNISIKLISETNGVFILRIDTSYAGAIGLPPSKPQFGWNPNAGGGGPIYYGWIYLAWGADHWDGYPIEPDINWSELQRKFGLNGSWTTVYTGTNRTWSDHSVTYDPNGDTPVFFRVRVRDTQNQWSDWSDIFSTKMVNINYSEKISDSDNTNIPSEHLLNQNFPNPFNPSTVINFAVKEAGLVKLIVYDILGAEVADLVNETKEAGYHSIEFNASQLPSGVYIYTLQINGFTSSKKMLLMK